MLEKILQEIREKAQELSKQHWGDDDQLLVGKGIVCMYVHAEEIIRSHMEDDGWIPVEKRLPDVSVMYSENVLTAVEWDDGDITCDIGWYNKYGVWSEDSDSHKVIAWRPLPAPYRPKEEN